MHVQLVVKLLLNWLKDRVSHRLYSLLAFYLPMYVVDAACGPRPRFFETVELPLDVLSRPRDINREPSPMSHLTRCD